MSATVASRPDEPPTPVEKIVLPAGKVRGNVPSSIPPELVQPVGLVVVKLLAVQAESEVPVTAMVTWAMFPEDDDGLLIVIGT